MFIYPLVWSWVQVDNKRKRDKLISDSEIIGYMGHINEYPHHCKWEEGKPVEQGANQSSYSQTKTNSLPEEVKVPSL